MKEVAPPTWLFPLLVKDRILTADAMHTQCKHCARIVRARGHYVLIGKRESAQPV
jgi:hypothetical protein